MNDRGAGSRAKEMPGLFLDRIKLIDGVLPEKQIANLFHPAATIALRYGSKMLVMTVLDYPLWLNAALRSANLTDFHEHPTVISVFEMGDIATVLVTTRAFGDGTLFERGVGTFGLIREDGLWKILSLAFEISESEPIT